MCEHDRKVQSIHFGERSRFNIPVGQIFKPGMCPLLELWAHSWFPEISLAKTACLRVGMSVPHEQTTSMNKGCFMFCIKGYSFLFCRVYLKGLCLVTGTT